MGLAGRTEDGFDVADGEIGHGWGQGRKDAVYQAGIARAAVRGAKEAASAGR